MYKKRPYKPMNSPKQQMKSCNSVCGNRPRDRPAMIITWYSKSDSYHSYRISSLKIDLNKLFYDVDLIGSTCVE